MSSKPKTPSLAEKIVIVPAAHTRVGDVAFQTEMYELFHRTPGARIGHMIGTPTVLLGALLLASRAPGPAALLLAIGPPGFVGLGAWLRRADVRGLVRASLLTTFVFYWLEMWAAFRILPLQLLHLLLRGGYRPERKRALEARVAAILAAPASDWRHPAARPD